MQSPPPPTDRRPFLALACEISGVTVIVSDSGQARLEMGHLSPSSPFFVNVLSIGFSMV